MAKIASFFRRYNFPQSHLDLLRIFLIVNQTNPVAKANAVCVCYDRRLSKDISHNKIGALSSYSRKLHQNNAHTKQGFHEFDIAGLIDMRGEGHCVRKLSGPAQAFDDVNLRTLDENRAASEFFEDGLTEPAVAQQDFVPSSNRRRASSSAVS